jgi:transketolase C-terminal domain/subunit
MEKARLLEQSLGKTVCVISLPFIKPLDEALILKYAQNAEGIFTIEEHSVIGGLGSLVSAVLWEHGVPKKKFHAFGFPDRFVKDVGDRSHLLGLVGIEANALAKKVKEIMQKAQA